MRRVLDTWRTRILGRNRERDPARAGVSVSEGELPQGLLYARGFLLLPHGHEPPSSVTGWKLFQVGQWALHVDPRVPVQHAELDGREVLLLGDAFDPHENVYADVARYLLEGDLLARLDSVAGRFVVFLRGPGGKIDVYHDAMGSRSVFYSNSGVVGSHAGLVADVIGAGLREWVIPFITSKSFHTRDVKYLPGLQSPFEGVAQLTPNCRLGLPAVQVQRYWPRAPLASTERDFAEQVLTMHLKGLKEYLGRNAISPILGLSAGRDSRGILAGVAELHPALFTFVRSANGKSEVSKDSKTARELVKALGLELEIVRILAPAPLDQARSPFAAAYRRNTGYVRGGGSVAWIEHFVDRNFDDHLFVRGFGGEVMRGFYSDFSRMEAAQLAAKYDVNAGSRYTLEAFEDFMRVAGWSPQTLLNYKLSDLVYWEHRMGVWGASALAESDMVFRTMPGYNSRSLFTAFMGLKDEIRASSALFEAVTNSMAPDLRGVPYDS